MQSVYISDVCAWVPRHEGVLYQINSGALNSTSKIITLKPHHDCTLPQHLGGKWSQ